MHRIFFRRNEDINIIHAHPTLSEAIMEAATNADGEAINI